MKRNSMLKSILIATILSLCVSGIGYASWNVSLSTGTLVETGNMELSFINNYSIDPAFEENIIVNISHDTVSIAGTVDSEDALVPVTLYVNNTGTLPVMLQDKLIGTEAPPEELQLQFDCRSGNQTLVYTLPNGTQGWEKSLYINCEIRAVLAQEDEALSEANEQATLEVPLDSFPEPVETEQPAADEVTPEINPSAEPEPTDEPEPANEPEPTDEPQPTGEPEPQDIALPDSP